MFSKFNFFPSLLGKKTEETQQEDIQKKKDRENLEKELWQQYKYGLKESVHKLDIMLRHRCCPSVIEELKDNEVFVFGSKPNGHHESGAAKVAVDKYGAEEGKGNGFSGQSYAIPVHKIRIDKMDEAVKEFIAFAKKNPELSFKVLPIGCGKAGMDTRVVAEMFSPAINVRNIYLHESFVNALMLNRKEKNITQFTIYPNFYVLRREWIEKLRRCIKESEVDNNVLGHITVKMDCSVEDAIEYIIDMCLPYLKLYYPELKGRKYSTEEVIWVRPDVSDVSLALNQITEGWYQCISYRFGHDWYSPTLLKNDIFECLTYPLALYGAYFDKYAY